MTMRTLPETVGDGLVSIGQVAIDGDDDVSDDRKLRPGRDHLHSWTMNPTIGPIANSIVDFEQDDFANEDLNGDVGKRSEFVALYDHRVTRRR